MSVNSHIGGHHTCVNILGSLKRCCVELKSFVDVSLVKIVFCGKIYRKFTIKMIIFFEKPHTLAANAIDLFATMCIYNASKDEIIDYHVNWARTMCTVRTINTLQIFFVCFKLISFSKKNSPAPMCDTQHMGA